jgi:predicted MFS family arabinose efflux permease
VVTAALTSYAFLDQSTPIVIIEIIFFVQGAAMANIMPPATTAIMEALPREKAGVGSAMSNTVRQISGALGVAVLGSLLGRGQALSLHVPLLVATVGYLVAIALAWTTIRDR